MIAMMIFAQLRPARTYVCFFSLSALIPAGAIVLGSVQNAFAADFGPSNPFYAPSTLPFQAPPFDKIKDDDYQPRSKRGWRSSRPKSGRSPTIRPRPLLTTPSSPWRRAGVAGPRDGSILWSDGRNINPTLQNVKTIEAPKLAAHQDFLFLNTKLFARIAALYKERGTLGLDAESLRLLERYYDDFVHGRQSLGTDKTEMRS